MTPPQTNLTSSSSTNEAADEAFDWKSKHWTMSPTMNELVKHLVADLLSDSNWGGIPEFQGYEFPDSNESESEAGNCSSRDRVSG